MEIIKRLFPDRNDLLLVLCAIPLYIAAVGKYGLKIAVALCLSCCLGAALEMAAHRIRKRPNGILGTPAWVLFPLVLPPVFPLWMTGVSLGVGILLGVVVWGGHGYARLSPLALGWTTALIGFSSALKFGWSLPFPSVTFGFTRYNAAVLTVAHPLRYIDTRMFRLPHPIMTVLTGDIPQTPGNAIPVVLMACGLCLLLLRVIDARSCLAFIGTVVGLAITWNILFPERAQHLLELCIGNLMLAAFFIVPDRRTASRTQEGRWLIGILTGLTAFLFRYVWPVADGVLLAILIGNIIAPVIDQRILALRYKKKENYL